MQTEFKNLDEVIDAIIKNLTAESKEFLDNCPRAERFDFMKAKFIFPEQERIDHKVGQRTFTCNAHHGFGTGVRNALNLWWTPELSKKYPSWPQEKPQLIEWFESVGLDGTWGVSGDDRSGLLMEAFYAKYHNLDFSIADYIKRLKDFYSKQSEQRKSKV